MGQEKNRSPERPSAVMDEWVEQAKDSFDDRQQDIYRALESRGFEPFYGIPGSTAEADAVGFMCDYILSSEGIFLMVASNRMSRVARNRLHEVVQPAIEKFQGSEQDLDTHDDGTAASQAFFGSVADVDYENRAWSASVASLDYLNRLCDELNLPPYRDVYVLDDRELMDLGFRKLHELMKNRRNRFDGGDE